MGIGPITYERERRLLAADYIDCVGRTTLGASRPLANPERIQAMLEGANFIVTARDNSGALVGLARCLCDDAWICYCADLAVRDSHQGQGIGRAIIEKARNLLGPGIGFILVSEPSAASFYERAGMQRHTAFFHPRTDAS
jgi:GNAT superfamily N-acetyltransferase